MSQLKVALVSHEFPPFVIGGMGTHCYDLAYSLSKKKILTTVFCGRSRAVRVEKLNPYLHIVRFPFLDFPPRFLWFQVQNFRRLLKLLRGFDIIHGVNPLASAACSYIQHRLKIPFVTTIHEVFLSDLRVLMNSPLSDWTMGDLRVHAISYPLNEFLVRTCIKSANHVVVCGKTALRDMTHVYRNLDNKKISVIYNGVNFDSLNKLLKDSYEQGSFVAYHGRLVWRKGLVDLIKAMAILQNDFPDLNLKIIGKGPLERIIKLLRKKLNLTSKVHLLGYVQRADLIEELQTCSFAVLPSLYEVGPFISGLEVMACEKVLIASDTPFAREFISDMRTGVLAKPGDAEDLAAKMRLVLSDGRLRESIAENARKYVSANHNWDSLVDKYLDIYETVKSTKAYEL